MIGDAKAKGKSRGAKAYMGKNSEGRSHKINLPSASDGGGDSEQKPTAKRMDKHNARPGTGTRDKQNPSKQRSRRIEAWCEGKSEHYK